jgi:Ca-activated chloride channel family protein
VRVCALAIATLTLVPVLQPVPAGRVAIHVRVVDQQGRPITDLQASDFEIRDKGRARPVESFAAAVPARSVVVLLDTSTSMTTRIDALLAATGTVLTALPASDSVRLGKFANRTHVMPVISGSRADAFRAFRSGLTVGGSSALYDALLDSIDLLAGDDRRRAIVLMTDGGDTSSRRQEDDVLARAQALDVAVSVLAFPDPRSPVHEASWKC